ncbi:MAG: FAD-dependent 5-carboxymethylaminomethyl-2-thiouridine(34) oxidoreductase MnmC [Methylotenera sp.]
MANKSLTAIVIGAGIAGCSTAYALSKRGIAVTLIDRHEQVAQEASGNPVGMLYPKFNTGISAISAIAERGFAYTLSLLRQMSANQEIYRLCGQIQLANTIREKDKQSLLNVKLKQAFDIQPLNAKEASRIANIELLNGGLYIAESGWVKPQLLCQALIESQLIKKLMTTSAIHIKQIEDFWQVTFQEKSALETDIVVLANANDIVQFEQCNTIPITAVRGQINFFPSNSVSNELKTILCTDHYLGPNVDGFHSIGTSYAPNDMNPQLSSVDTNDNLRALSAISTALYKSIDTDEVTGRVAWRSATRDYIPLAGQLINNHQLRKKPPRYNDKPTNLPWLKGLYMNAGHGSKGLITAPLCGELIANLVNQEPLIVDPLIASKMNPSRFMLREMGLKKIAQNLYDI